MKVKILAKPRLFEAERDAKILRNINIDFLKKEVEKGPDEEIRDYFTRLQQLERKNPPVFPPVLVNWVESLDDRYFPRDGRKMFAKWLGNAVWHEEAEERSSDGADFSDLTIYNNDIRYIVDYLNGANDIPREVWNLTFPQMTYAAEEWHEQLSGIPEVTGDYGTKKVVHNFENGFTIVKVPSEDLEVEGNKMGHCVGEYCDYVDAGATAIFSLRSKKNKPHATIEIVKSTRRQDVITPQIAFEVEQIKGKGNDIPAEKYRPMIKQWLATTNYEYKESDDYFDMLSTEEVLQMLEDKEGVVSSSRIQKIARRAKDPQIIDFLIFKYGTPPIINLARNHHLSLEQATAIFKKNLPLSLLGRQVENLFHVERSPRLDGPGNYSSDELAAAVWPGVKNTVASGALLGPSGEELMYSMDAIVSNSSNEKLNREVVLTLLDKNVVDDLVYPHSAGRRPRSINRQEVVDFIDAESGRHVASLTRVYTSIIQSYLSSTDHHDRDTLKKIHELTKSSAGEDLAPDFNVQSYIAKSQSIPKDLAEEIANNPVGHTTIKSLMMNPNVSESLKYGIMKERLETWKQPDGKSRGLMAILGRAMWEEPEVFSEKFLLWSLDATVFDAVIERKAEHKFMSLHLPGTIDKVKDKNWHEIFQKEKEKMREDIKRRKAFQRADQDPDRELPSWMGDFGPLGEEVKKYFRSLKKRGLKNLTEEIGAYLGDTPEERDDQGDGLDLRDREYKEFFDKQGEDFFKDPDHEVPWKTEA